MPVRYSHDLIALRWVQRTLFVSDKLTEASVLGNEANAVEAGEMEEALGRVERDNMARMSALYRRHVHETEAGEKRGGGGVHVASTWRPLILTLTL